MHLIIKNHKFQYETENLLRVFFPEKITVTDDIPEEEDYCFTQLDGSVITVKIRISDEEYSQSKEFFFTDKVQDETDESFLERKLALMMYDMLRDATGYTPPWGILTGVRPAKLMSNLIKKYGELWAVPYFTDELQVSREKTNLALRVAYKEEDITEKSRPDSCSLYISVPFCPTRCSYCSFISHSNESAKKLIPEYVEKLCEELEVTAKIIKEQKLRLESIYIGGGTPTVLTAEQLKRVTDTVSESFDLSVLKEYTVEAGRPDCTTEEKLRVLKGCGCTRISINPQTFNDGVLEAIGRNHTSQMTVECFDKARELGFDNINMDLIAGLPTDTVESFEESLKTAISMNPENITVHTLALKRSSNIVTESRQTNSAHNVTDMLEKAQPMLLSAGFYPYYMYRQSKCLGNLENVGWAKNGYECLYNVYMMEECHTVLSVGAGAVIKLKAPHGNEIERIFNYKYPYEYISGFDEIIKRKEYIGEFYRKFTLTGDSAT